MLQLSASPLKMASRGTPAHASYSRYPTEVTGDRPIDPRAALQPTLDPERGFGWTRPLAPSLHRLQPQGVVAWCWQPGTKGVNGAGSVGQGWLTGCPSSGEIQRAGAAGPADRPAQQTALAHCPPATCSARGMAPRRGEVLKCPLPLGLGVANPWP
jgi:hypothetical protein